MKGWLSDGPLALQLDQLVNHFGESIPPPSDSRAQEEDGAQIVYREVAKVIVQDKRQPGRQILIEPTTIQLSRA